MTSTQVTLGTLVRGFDAAFARLQPLVADIQTPLEEAFLPLFETLNWAVSLSDLAAQTTPLGADPGDLRGLRYARNRVHHQWANALETGEVVIPRPFWAGTTLSRGSGQIAMIGPVVANAWTWVSAASLPSGRQDPTGEAAYIARLQGQAAHAILDRLSSALSSLR